MKLTIKDLQQKKFFIEVDPSATILEVKQKIQETEKHDVEAQKLIYSGKILQDDQTVESYKIQEKDFVVCMVKKPKPAPSTPVRAPSTPTPTTSSPAPAAMPPAPQPGAVPFPVTPATHVATSTPPAPRPAAAPAAVGPAAFNDPNAFSIGAAREGAIQELMSMGFDRHDVERAMRAAFNNPDRAVEYLMDGIPAHLQQEFGPRSPGAQQGAPPPATQPPQAAQQPTQSAPPTAAQPAPATNPPSTAGGPINLFEAAARAAQQRHGLGGQQPQTRAQPAPAALGRAGGAGAPTAAAAGGAPASLEALRENPQFQQLRNLVQSNPQLLEPIIQNIAQGNPQLAALINQNPEGFLQLLAEESGEGGLPPNAIQVTPEEREAIGRLEALGFPRHMAIQAYIACDKNEEIAANYLFEHGYEDEDEDEDAPAA